MWALAADGRFPSVAQAHIHALIGWMDMREWILAVRSANPAHEMITTDLRNNVWDALLHTNFPLGRASKSGAMYGAARVERKLAKTITDDYSWLEVIS